MSTDMNHHHFQAPLPPVSYAKIVKEGDGYENHDYQPSDAPGAHAHDPAHRPTTFAGAVKLGEGGHLHDVPGIIPHTAPSALVHRNKQHEPTPPTRKDAVSLDMASGSPVTLDRRAGQSGEHSGFPHPSIPRARVAADPKAGSKADAQAKERWEAAVSDAHARRAWERRSVLEKHCAFFDRDHDGVIWPHDTFIGFWRLGFGLILSFVSMVVIHSGFSWLSGDSFLPDPFFRFYIHNAYKCKHGSDSQTYDTEGRFTPQKFDDIFAKYSSDPAHEYLTIPDTVRMLKGNRIIVDPFGWFAAVFEWGSLWYLLWPRDRRMKREDVRAAYSGDLFYRIAHERQQRGGKRRHHQGHAEANAVNGTAH